MSIFFTTAADKSLITAAGKSFKRQSLMTYTLLVTLCEGVSSANIKRTSTVNPSAETNITITTTSVIPVYYGDVVEITPTVMTHYDILGTWPQTITIIENSSIEIDADYNPPQLTQLQPLIINSGAYSYLEEDREARITVNITNPNNVPVWVNAKLFKIHDGEEEVASATDYYELAANTTGSVAFEDPNDTLDLDYWGSSQYYGTGALVGVRCEGSPTNPESYKSSYWQFWTNCDEWSQSLKGLNNRALSEKLPDIGTVTAYYHALSTGGYEVHFSVSGYAWPITQMAFMITCPNGIQYINYHDNDTIGTEIVVDSVDAVVKIQAIDLTSLGFLPSNEVLYNLADARDADAGDDNTADTR